MEYPPLLKLTTTAEYRNHFENIYCRKPIDTFDGIQVRFRKRDFNHCFFESSRRDGQKDIFSKRRAERMEWIKIALKDKNAERYWGWKKSKKSHTRSRRVTVVMDSYIVVIEITAPGKANFITAFVADSPATSGMPSTLEKIRKSPKWT